MRIRGDAEVSPQTPRLRVRLWRDPRMIVGLVLIAGSMVGGGLALAAADRTETYWAVRASVQEGDPVLRSSFTPVKVKVPERTAKTLLPAGAELPSRLSSMVWAQALPGGTLISREHLAARQRVVELPVTVSPSGAPADLRRGDRVDVWVSTGERDPATPGRAAKVLSGVRVLARANSGGMDGAPGFTVVVDAGGAPVDGRLVAAVSSGRVTLVRRS
jgi:hypothetical protein